MSMTDHRNRYGKLVEQIGLDKLKPFLPPKVQIERAFAEGDEHLNAIPLHYWDRQACSGAPMQTRTCPTCGGVGKIASRFRRMPDSESMKGSTLFNLIVKAKRQLGEPAVVSLSDGVCVLKEAARILIEVE